MQQRALRTLENLASIKNGSPTARLFQSEAIIDILLSVLASENSDEETKGLACSVISRLIRQSSELFTSLSNNIEDLRLLLSGPSNPLTMPNLARHASMLNALVYVSFQIWYPFNLTHAASKYVVPGANLYILNLPSVPCSERLSLQYRECLWTI